MARVNQGYYRQLRAKYRDLTDEVHFFLERYMLDDALPTAKHAKSAVKRARKYRRKLNELVQEFHFLLQSQKFENPDKEQEYRDMMDNADCYLDFTRNYVHDILEKYSL